MPSVTDYSYDEFSMFHENLSEWNIDVPIPFVRRFFVSVDGLRQLSGLAWGSDAPELVLVHGGAQNAHTFDTVALALQRSLIALDLPGHGHSDASPYPHSAIVSHANDVSRALDQLISPPLPLVGMSLGGLTALLVAHDRPDLVRSLVLIDITPGVNSEKARHITDFVNGPRTFENFDALLARTIEHNPTRSVSSLRRGILHNALQQSDGTWVWRHQRDVQSLLDAPDSRDLWQALSELEMPVTLLRAMGTGSVVDDEDEAEFLRRLPSARVVHVRDSGHSIQGDQPLALAALLNRLCLLD
ncbi:MAG: alpha/beta hydrolase [Acidimicrobiaceae bacterium]|nr:alpha/beta hydrolase [Acidimicrobiaceae bacterium]